MKVRRIEPAEAEAVPVSTGKKQNRFLHILRKHWMLLLMLAPSFLYVVVFSYIPMTGLVLAFKRYNQAGGIYGSPWCGLANFKAMMIDGKIGMVTRNTFLYNLAFIFLGVVFEMGSAILLNEILNKHFKKITQSLMFLPYFISWVVVSAIMYNIFNYEKGVFNHVLTMLGSTPVDLYNSPKAWPFVLIFLRLWKQTGYGSVVYLAAITGLDQEMFEAASIDGAVPQADDDHTGAAGNRKHFPRRLWYVLPDGQEQRGPAAIYRRHRYLHLPTSHQQRKCRRLLGIGPVSVGAVLHHYHDLQSPGEEGKSGLCTLLTSDRY